MFIEQQMIANENVPTTSTHKRPNASLESVIPEKRVKTGFKCLNMISLGTYDLPLNTFNAERGEDAQHLNEIKEMVTQSKTDCQKYIEAYHQLLFLEESAEVISLQKYSRNNLKLQYKSETTFKILVDVGIFMIFLNSKLELEH